MKLAHRSIIAALSMLIAGEVFACQPPPPTVGFAKLFNNVVVGTIAGHGFVQRMPNEEPELLFKVRKIEILSGTTPTTITAVAPCGFPLKVGERVVVGTFSGRRYVYPSDYEGAFRTAHGRQR